MSSSPSLRPGKKLYANARIALRSPCNGLQFPLNAPSFPSLNRFSGAAAAALLGLSILGANPAFAGASADLALGGQGMPAHQVTLATLPADPMVTGAIAKPKKSKMGLLGSLEFKIERTPFQAAWTTLLTQVTRDWPFYMACQAADAGCSPGLLQWQKLIHSVQSLSPLQQLQRLNPAINAMAAYADDDVIYGVEDHWASPGEFFKGRADCEDYALVKLFTLIELGFTPDQLRLAIVKDRRRGVLHAILAVRLDGKTYVMDSLQSQPVEQQTVLKYEPIYSLNTEERWAHIVTPKTKSRFLAELNLPQPEGEQPAVKPRAEAAKSIVESTLYAPHGAAPSSFG